MSIPVSTKVKFIGYSELKPGDPEILDAGETVVITGYSAEEDQYTVERDGDENVVDSVFAEELEELPAEEEVAEEATKPARKRSKPAAKAKPAKEQAEEEQPDEEVEEAPKAKPKAKAKPKTAAKAKPAAKPKATTKAKSTAKAKPAEAKSDLVVIPMIEDFVGEADLAIQSAKDMAERLGEIAEQGEETKFTLGGTLAWIKANKAYETLGYDDIDAFCEKEVGLGKRSCAYYIRTYEDCTAAGVTEKDIAGIGFTKLRQLIGVVDSKNKRALLAKAKKMTRDDFADHVREIKQSKGKVSATDPNAATFMKFKAFKMFEDQGQAFDAAIEQAKETFDVDNFAEALFYMANEWMQGQEADIPVEHALSSLNARYGTELSLDDAEDEAEETVEE